MPTGRPTKYNKDILAKARDYLVNFDSYGDIVPSVAGLAVALRVGDTTVHRWATEDDKGEFRDTLEAIKTKQHTLLLSGGLSGEYNATIAKLMLANHGYSERSAVEMSGGLKTDNTIRVEFVDGSSDSEGV